MAQQGLPPELDLYLKLGLAPIPLKPRSKEPLVKWRNGWNPTPAELRWWAARPGINWGVRCGENLAVLDFDSEGAFDCFIKEHLLPPGCPVIRTGRGYHVWLRPKKAIASQRVNGLEVKCLGSYVVAPPSVHLNGLPYTFEVAPNGALPEVALEEWLGLGRIDPYGEPRTNESIRQAGLATKVLTRSDGRMKHLVSPRDWKWDCPKCAPLLKRYWMGKLEALSFRFILRLPSVAKPAAFLRRVRKPPYIHILADRESYCGIASAVGEVATAANSSGSGKHLSTR